MILKFHRRRILFFFAIVLVLYCVLLAKMYSVQVVDRNVWREKLERAQVRSQRLWRKRGTVFDTNGTPLAFSYTTWSLAADPLLIIDKNRQYGGGDVPGAAARVATILGWDANGRAKLEQIFSQESSRFVWIARRLEPAIATRIRALKMKGLILSPEYKRFYTNPHLAPAVIGLVGADDKGLAGVEYSYDDQLSGLAGEQITFAGLRDLEIPKATLIVNHPKGGHHIYLTIDAGIQRIADWACEKLMADHRPTNCFVLVVDPMSGEIVACAMRPTFDQSNFREYSKDVSKAKNLPISHIFEPGSTFKIVTMAAALEEEKVNPATPFNCPGYLSLWGIKIGCTSVHGDLSATDVLEKSCNVGAMSMGVVLGARTLYYYLRKYGFGEKTGVELPGEANGIVRLPKDWSGLSVAAIAMGQEVGVTGLQMAMAASAVVNGGKLLKPTIIKRVASHDNRKVLYRARPTVRHQVISPETAEKVKTMMGGVVIRGTGKRAGSDYYTAGGKTGTSQKLGKRSRALKESGERNIFNEKVVTSFVGFFPYDKPQYLIYIMANEPQTYRAAGGTVAAPLFREIASRIVWYKGMVPTSVVHAPIPLPEGVAQPAPKPGPPTDVADKPELADQPAQEPTTGPTQAPDYRVPLRALPDPDMPAEEAIGDEPPEEFEPETQYDGPGGAEE